jgi:hypothetical protein
MKTTDLAPKDVKEVWNSPMGMMSKLGNTLVSKVAPGTDTGAAAKGKLNTGAVANKAWSGYQSFLGQTGEKPTTSNIILWLQHNKYSPDAIKAAETVLRDAAKAAKDATAKQAEKDNPKVQTFSEPAMGGASANPPPDDIAESRKPMHHLDMMRSYLDILSDKTIAEAPGSMQRIKQGQMAAAGLNGTAPAPATTNDKWSEFTKGMQPGAGETASDRNQARAKAAGAPAAPAPAPTAAPVSPNQPAAGDTVNVSPKTASQAIMAAAQAQAKAQYAQQPAPAATATPAPAATATPASAVEPSDARTDTGAPDLHSFASNFHEELLASKSNDPKTRNLLTALEAYLDTSEPLKKAAESLNFSESFNPGKMLQKKVTKLTRIK